MNGLWERWKACFPAEPEWKVDWDSIAETGQFIWITAMQQTQQNLVWHGEGDVWTHTQMVCEELVCMPLFRKLPVRQQQEVFLAALLHDIGKVRCTRMEAGEWTSPNHAVIGSRMAREWLWKQWGLSGSEEARIFRETVCWLIRYHAVPPHILTQKNPERRLIQIAANGELAEDFSLELLCLLSAADVLGRITDRKQESLETVELCAETAKDAGCLKKPLFFAAEASKYAYLSGRTAQPELEWYDDTWGEVILLSGLPGTGKDTWIQNNGGEYPVVSLDEIRKQMHISPKEAQGAVISQAKEQAMQYLRKKQPFIWNGTNLTGRIREKQIRLFEGYHASVRVVFLETEWEEGLRRNRQRVREVPEQVIADMLQSLVLPERGEARSVEWYCV